MGIQNGVIGILWTSSGWCRLREDIYSSREKGLSRRLFAGRQNVGGEKGGRYYEFRIEVC